MRLLYYSDLDQRQERRRLRQCGTLLNEIDVRKHFLTLDIGWIKAHQIEKEKDAKLKEELKNVLPKE